MFVLSPLFFLFVSWKLVAVCGMAVARDSVLGIGLADGDVLLRVDPQLCLYVGSVQDTYRLLVQRASY